MRCLLGFGVILVALGVFRLVGCSEETAPLPLECVEDADCDDANECTDDSCVEKQRWFEGEQYGRCENSPAWEGSGCHVDGAVVVEECRPSDDGFCVSGTCKENPCYEGNECTPTNNPSDDGSCEEHGDPTEYDGCFPCDWNGEPGVCMAGACQEDPCKSVVCDDGDLCTNDWCDHSDGTCQFDPVNCGDGNDCTNDTCDPDTGWCSNTPKPDGQPCCYRGHWECCEFLCFSRCYVCDVAGYCDSGTCVE